MEESIKKIHYLFLKRFFDILIGSLGMILVGLFSIILLPFYKFDRRNYGPVFYKQRRIGLNGNDFSIYKFRTMIVDAESELQSNDKLYQRYKQNNYKLEPSDDPRITKIGEFLRKTSIDELPQFLNVLRGEMSIVGPRPVVLEELHEYDKDKLLSVKPGIMGLWQARGRSEVGYPDRANIEMEYIDKASIIFDMKIFIKNIIVVFKQNGAY